MPHTDDSQFAPVTLGEIVQQRSFGWFRITHARLPPNQRLPGHRHRHPRLTIVRQGGFELELARDSVSLDRSGVYYKPREVWHGSTISRFGLESLIIEVMVERLRDSLEERLALPDQGGLFGGRADATVAAAVESEYDARDAPSAVALEGLVLELLASLMRAPKPADVEVPAWLRRARAMLHDRFADDLALVDIANEVAIHPSHLARTFRATFGSSIGEYQRRLRLQHAARLLASDHQSLATIAHECGFYDQSHMTRWFRKTFGTTPAKYRRSAPRRTGGPRRR